MDTNIPVKLRVATIADIPALEELITLSARGLSVGFYTAEQIESAITYVFGVDSQLIADRTYFVAESGEQFVGCGGWSKRRTLYGGDQFKQSQDPFIDPRTDPARIRAFFVHPDWGRRSIARMLLNECEMAASGEGFTRLELGSTLPGVPFYSALGFEALEGLQLSFPNGVLLPLQRMGKTIAGGQ